MRDSIEQSKSEQSSLEYSKKSESQSSSKEEDSTNTEQKLASNPMLTLDPPPSTIRKHNSYLNFWRAADVFKAKLVECNLAGKEKSDDGEDEDGEGVREYTLGLNRLQV